MLFSGTMDKIPQRSSLVAQVAEILSRGIQEGEWSEHLPPEREICRRLHVSRPTVRGALLTLQREGLIRTIRGQRRRIVASTNDVKRSVMAKCEVEPAGQRQFERSGMGHDAGNAVIAKP